VNLLVPTDPIEMSNIDSPETAQDTLGPSKTKKEKSTKKTEELEDVDSLSIRMDSITPDEVGDDEEGTETQRVEVPLPQDEEDSLKKRKVSPLKSSSRKKPRTPVTKMKTTLMLDDFDFIVTMVNDASKEIIEKQEVKQEKMYSQIEIALQGVQQELQSSRPTSTAPLPEGTTEVGDESVQLRKIVDIVKVRLQHGQD
jgi:hypothetical protein